MLSHRISLRFIKHNGFSPWIFPGETSHGTGDTSPQVMSIQRGYASDPETRRLT